MPKKEEVTVLLLTTGILWQIINMSDKLRRENIDQSSERHGTGCGVF